MTHGQGNTKLHRLLVVLQIHSRLHFHLKDIDKLPVDRLQLSTRRDVSLDFATSEAGLESKQGIGLVVLIDLQLSIGVKSLAVTSLAANYELIRAEWDLLEEELQLLPVVRANVCKLIHSILVLRNNK